MRCEAPDSQFFAELRDLNLAFLALAVAGRQRGYGPVFGLDDAVLEALVRLTTAQLEAAALVPCLLVAFAPRPTRLARQVAEPPPGDDADWVEQARLFAAGLLAYARQASRRDELRAALVVGATERLPDGAGYRDIRSEADRALQHLQARFRDSPRFWPELVRAARDGHAQRLQLARLAAIQLATIGAGVSPGPAPALAPPILAALR